MPTVPAESLLQQLRWRYAVKKFDPARKIPADTWSHIESAVVLAPSSYGLQPWKFFVVQSPAVRQSLRAASWNQAQITDASHLIVFARQAAITPADVDRHVDRVLRVRGGARADLAGFRDMMLGSVTSPSTLPGGSIDSYTRSQVYIALGFALYTAALLDVDACPMEGFEPAKYDEILGLAAKGYKASVVATFGYRAADDWLAGLPKVRFEHRDVVEHV